MFVCRTVADSIHFSKKGSGPYCSNTEKWVADEIVRLNRKEWLRNKSGREVVWKSESGNHSRLDLDHYLASTMDIIFLTCPPKNYPPTLLKTICPVSTFSFIVLTHLVQTSLTILLRSSLFQLSLYSLTLRFQSYWTSKPMLARQLSYLHPLQRPKISAVGYTEQQNSIRLKV